MKEITISQLSKNISGAVNEVFFTQRPMRIKTRTRSVLITPDDAKPAIVAPTIPETVETASK